MALAATKLLPSHLHPLPSPKSFSTGDLPPPSCLPGPRTLVRPQRSVTVRVNAEPLLALQLDHHNSAFFLADTVGYSMASYYTSLGLFVISVPGLWSLIKRSVKSKVLLIHIQFQFQFQFLALALALALFPSVMD